MKITISSHSHDLKVFKQPRCNYYRIQSLATSSGCLGSTSGTSFVLLFLHLLIGLSDLWTGLTCLSHELGQLLLKLDPLPSLGPLYGMPFPSLCVRLSFLDHCLHLSLSP